MWREQFRSCFIMSFVLLPLGTAGCAPAQHAIQLQSFSGNCDVKSVETWDLVRIDLDIELEPRLGELRGSGTARLRLIRGPSAGPTLALGNVSRFTKLAARVGDGGTVEFAPHRGDVRFKQPLQTGAEVNVMFEFHSGGDSCPVVVTRNGAYARSAGMWHPQLLVGSPAAPGTTRLHAPAEWKTLSNGILTDTRIEGNQRIDTWISEVPAARSFAAGPYTVREFSFGSRTYGVYLLSADDAKAKTYGQGMAKVLAALEARFGPYPYESCSIVEIPESAAAWRAASEHGFVVAPPSELPDDSFNLTLIAHELAHQWWGNFVGSRNPAAQMVDEALAEYGTFLAIESIEGGEAAAEFLRLSKPDYDPCPCGGGYYDRERRHRPDKPLMQLTGEGHDYWLATAKGLWVYHMLRAQVGDELFFGTLRELIARHGGSEMSLADLRAEFVGAAPREAELEMFFDHWLDRPGAPVLDVTWTAEDGVGGPGAQVTIRQKGEPFELRLEVAVDARGASKTHVVQLSSEGQSFLLAAPGAVTGVRIDPRHRLLIGEVTIVEGLVMTQPTGG